MAEATSLPCPRSEHGDTHHLVTANSGPLKGRAVCAYCGRTQANIEGREQST